MNSGSRVAILPSALPLTDAGRRQLEVDSKDWDTMAIAIGRILAVT